MAKKKKYDNDNTPVTMAGESAVAYKKSPAATAMIGRKRSMTVDEYFDKVRKALNQRNDGSPAPCQYTEEEAVQRVLQATADVDAGRNLMSLEEFEKLVYEEELKPYTIEELHERIARSERDFAEGRWQDSEDMFRELEEELKIEDEETMDIETAREMTLKAVREEYALP